MASRISRFCRFARKKNEFLNLKTSASDVGKSEKRPAQKESNCNNV